MIVYFVFSKEKEKINVEKNISNKDDGRPLLRSLPEFKFWYEN